METEPMSHGFFLCFFSPMLPCNSLSATSFALMATLFSISLHYHLSHTLFPTLSPTPHPPFSDWSTLVQEKALQSWILSCHLAYVQAQSKAWRHMFLGWILLRSCRPGLICWWRVATMLLSLPRRSPRSAVGMGKSACWEFTSMTVLHYSPKKWVSGRIFSSSSLLSASECPQTTAFG